MHITHTALISKIVAVQEEKDEKSINTTDMTKKKLAYEAPKTQALSVRFDGTILTVSGEMNAKSWTTGNSSWWEDDDE